MEVLDILSSKYFSVETGKLRPRSIPVKGKGIGRCASSVQDKIGRIWLIGGLGCTVSILDNPDVTAIATTAMPAQYSFAAKLEVKETQLSTQDGWAASD